MAKSNILIGQKIISMPNDKANHSRYMNEICKFDALTKKQEQEYFTKLRAGETKYYDILVQTNLRFVVSVAKSFQSVVINTNITLEDLISEGNLGLCEAIDKYDHTLGYKFISFAVFNIKNRILLCIQNNIRNIRMSTNRQQLLRDLNRLESDLEQKFQCEIDENILFEYAKEKNIFTEKHTVNLISNMKNEHTIEKSISYAITDDGLELIEVLVNENAETPSKILIDQETFTFIEKILCDLPSRSREIAESFYGLNAKEKLTIHELAEIHGCSHQNISAILKSLRNRLNKHHKEEYKRLINN